MIHSVVGRYPQYPYVTPSTTTGEEKNLHEPEQSLDDVQNLKHVYVLASQKCPGLQSVSTVQVLPATPVPIAMHVVMVEKLPPTATHPSLLRYPQADGSDSLHLFAQTYPPS